MSGTPQRSRQMTRGTTGAVQACADDPVGKGLRAPRRILIHTCTTLGGILSELCDTRPA